MYAWKFGYEFTYSEMWQAIALSLAKVGAFGGMAMFALSLILSGRYKFYEQLFGGLDKMYVAHRFLGTTSVFLLFLHPVALSLLVQESGFNQILKLWLGLTSLGVLLGVLALYSLIGLVIWSVFARYKYETFIKVHRFLGVAFILGALHAFMSGSILSTNPFMYTYMFTLSAAGVITFIIYSLLGDMLHQPLKYRLIEAKSLPNNITELILEPVSRIINYAPGQFVYIAFEGLDEHGYHPFSISSDKRSSKLKLAIRTTGDFTKQLDSLPRGTIANVKGPYGGFILRPSTRKQLWIAGGIGVTPFISGALSLEFTTRFKHGDIEMIYATNDNKAYGSELLQRIEETNDIFNVTLFPQDDFGYVSFSQLSEHIKDLEERDIYICGPPNMLNSLVKEAEKLGLQNQLKYEEFDY